MTTDTMREKFETEVTKYPLQLDINGYGDYVSIVTHNAWMAYQAAYAQGQRDLIEAMGDPVAWVSVHKNFTGCTTNKHNAEEWKRDKTGKVYATYRIPKGYQK